MATKYKGELKSIQKTIRLTETVYDYINSMEGDGFNQKFENAILILMEEKLYQSKTKKAE